MGEDLRGADSIWLEEDEPEYFDPEQQEQDVLEGWYIWWSNHRGGVVETDEEWRDKVDRRRNFFRSFRR